MQPFKFIYHFVMLALGLIILVTFAACEKSLPPPQPYQPKPFQVQVPQGFPALLVPPDNPLTQEGIALGRKLFYDPILSQGQSISCGGCHQPSAAFSDPGQPFSIGATGQMGTRNAQALINLGFKLKFLWDGRAASLEEQVLKSIRDPLEMALGWPAALSRLNSRQDYREAFAKAFNTSSIDSLHVAKAIAQFMRILISGNSRFDRYLRGELQLNFSELSGFQIFNTEKGDCFHCHPAQGGRLFTDNQFRNNALDAEPADLGRALVTGADNDRGKFATPTLRNISYTAPYMHDGRFESLEEVIDFYNTGGVPSPYADPLMKFQGTGLNLTATEKQDLINFLKTLNDESFVNNPSFSAP